jgi:hypothetical protein
MPEWSQPSPFRYSDFLFRFFPPVVENVSKSYLSESRDNFMENDSSKSESHPVNYYLSKSLKVFGLKYQVEVGSLHTS